MYLNSKTEYIRKALSTNVFSFLLTSGKILTLAFALLTFYVLIPRTEVKAAYATPTLVQSNSYVDTCDSDDNESATFSSSVTAGNLIVVALSAWDNSQTLSITSVTDNKGNTYHLAVEDKGSDSQPLAIWYAENVLGGSSFTVTASFENNSVTSSCITFGLHEYSGIATSNAFDKTASNHIPFNGTWTTSADSGNTATTTQTHELIFGASTQLDYNSPSPTITAGSGFSLRVNEADNVNYESLFTEDKNVTSTGAYNATFTYNKVAPWRAAVATFKAAETGITISGNVYSDEAGSPTAWVGSGKCDNSSAVISISVNGGTKQSTTCDGTTGAFSFTVSPSAANQVIAIFLDTNGGDKGVLYTKNNDTTSNITGLKLTRNRVWIQSESSQSISNANINTYDVADDSDIPANSNGTNLLVDSGVELHINTGDTYAPGGDVTVDNLDVRGTYSGSTETLTLTASGTGACSTEPGTIQPLCIPGTFTAPTNVNYIGETGNTTIAGATYTNLGVGTAADSNTGRTFSLGGNTTVSGTITVGNASSTNTDTFDSSSYTLTLTGTTPWDITSKGQLSSTSGTVAFTTSTIIPEGTYNNIVLAPTSNSTTYTLPNGNVTVNGNFTAGDGTHTGVIVDAVTNPSALTVTGNFTISANTTYEANDSSTLTVGGNWTNNGTFIHDSGTVVFNTSSAGKTISGNLTGSNKFNAVTFNGSGSWSVNSNMEVAGNFNLTSGSLTQGANADIFITGDSVTLAEGTKFTKASGTGKFKLDGPSGNQVFNDQHASKVNLGHVQVGASPGTTTLASDMLATDLTIPTSDTLNTKGYDITLTDFLDCQGTCVLDTTDTAPNNEGDGTKITVGGNWTMSSTGTFNSSNSIVEFNGTVNQTVTTGGKAFYNFRVNNTAATNDDIIISGNLTVNNDLTVTDGELRLDTNNPTVDVNGSVIINSTGTLTASSSATFTVAINWTNSGTFNHSSGTVTFDTTGITVLNGATTFYNFTSVTPGKTIKFQRQTLGSPIFTFAGTVTITGTSGSRINIQSDLNAAQWVAHFNSAQNTITYATIRDSGCDTGTASVSESATNTSSGNNGYCWGVDKPTFSESSWYSSLWTKRKKISIDESKIPGTSNLTNFPLLISRTDTDLRDNAQSDGDDIMFTLSDGKTKLRHEIESYNSGTGELIAWLKIPSLKSMVNSDIYIYYGNTTAQNQQNPTDVWDTNFKGTWHMDASGTAIPDSTVNGNNATTSNTNDVTGKTGYAQSFNNTSTSVTAPETTSLNITGNTITLEAWVKRGTSTETGTIIDNGTTGTNGYFLNVGVSPCSTDQIDLVKAGVTSNCGGSLPEDTNFHHVVAVADSTGVRYYIDGALNDTVSNTSSITSTTASHFNIGVNKANDNSTTQLWDGTIDEVRVSNTNRSANWITAEYNNQSSPSTFYTVASQEGVPGVLPSPISQKKVTGGSTIATYGWANETQVQFSATASDPSSSDTLYLCIEKDLISTAFSGVEDSCGSGTSYSGSPVTVTHTINGLSDTSQYHWQARIKDSSGNYSDWVEYNAGSDVEIARDTFTRGGSDTWGNATLGGGYTLGSSASHFDLNNTEGTIDVDFADTQYFTSLQNVTAQNIDATVRVKIDKVPTGSYGAAYIRARYGSSTGYYRARLKFSNSGNSVYVQGQQYTNSSNVTTDIGSDTQVSGLTYSINNYIWMRAQFTGVSPTTIKIKAWADGTSEPGTWNYTATDSTAVLQTSGAVGLMARLNTGVTNAPALFSFDDLSVKTTDETRDFGIDTTAPTTTGVVVYDGTTVGSDSDQNITGSLSLLSANWTTFGTNVSGLDKYQYSIGTTAGGTDTKTWTDFDTTTSINVNGLTLHTAQPYFFNVRAVDNAGNTSSVVSSNGQYVTATLTFSLSSNSITFTNLGVSNNNQDTKTTSVTTSTNAYNGYEIKAYRTGLMSNGTNTISDFGGGTYANPGTWGTGQCNGASCGYGYTSSDTTIGGVDKFAGGTKYAPFAATGPGDVVADHTQSVSGTAITNESFTITNKVAVPLSQPSGTYTTTIVYTVVPQY